MKANQESIRNGRVDLASLWHQESERHFEHSEGNDDDEYESFRMINYLKPDVLE